MPLVDVSYAPGVSDAELESLATGLVDLVAAAVDCPEEPWTGPAQPGDIEIRFHQRSERDVGALRLTIEVRTKLFESRRHDRQRRADLIRDGLLARGFDQLGVWLILAEGAWSQSS